MNTMMYRRDIELRKLPAASLSNIANILETNEDWLKIVPLIPKNLQSEQFERKYNCEHIQIMQKHAKETKRTHAEVLFEEWGTSGRVRPTLGTLMMILQRAQIFRAVDEIASMIGEAPPPRPDHGPGAPITTDLSDLLREESLSRSNNLPDFSQDNALCNNTTRKLSPSDLIKFSTNSLGVPSEAIPNIPALQSVGQQQEVSDMLKFTAPQYNSVSQSKEMIPDLSNMLSSSAFDNTGVSIPTQFDNTESSISNATDTSTQNDISQFIPNTLSPFSKSNMDIFGIIDMAILEDKKLLQFQYKELETMTHKFCDTVITTPTGPVGKIGSGGFGDVYVGTDKNHGSLAVKRVRTLYQISCDLGTAMKIFNTEVKSLSHLRHENIVPIFGYSIDGPTPCIVCKYIDGGSLQEKIAAKVLTEQQRINIMRGTAAGLKYIHHSEIPPQTGEVLSESVSQTSRKSYYLHGDVKSANILLTKDCVPKLCDFGLAKQLDTTLITRSMMGTSAYMAPEGFSGTVTQKNDIFSFGIVLLELLTGLKPIVSTNGENINIKNLVEDTCRTGDITELLDSVVPKWNIAQKVFALAKHCLEREKNDRPSIDLVCNTLNEI